MAFATGLPCAWQETLCDKGNGGQDAYQEKYRNLTRQFAKENGLPLADIDKALRTEISRHETSEFILPDGVHLTDRGNRIVADVVLAALTMEVSKFLSSAAPKSN
jgi:lysophospholipase L1-like esterase